MPIIRSISGLRATLDDCMTDELVISYCRAFHKLLPEGPIIIGRDGRPSGEKIEQLCSDTLVNSGREVRIAGIVPTPTVQLLTEHSDAAGGIAITASHNPSEWNGLKFIGTEGVFIDEALNQKLWKYADTSDFNPFTNTGKRILIDWAIDEHISRLLELEIFSGIIADVKKRKFRIVVDAVNASGSLIVPKLLKKFGAEVIELYCDGSGVFPHLPEPLPQNLTKLAEAVILYNADIGIAVDPDADRLVLIDETGHPIGEELTISISVHSILDYYNSSPNASKGVVVNLSTTRLVDDICLMYNSELSRSPVGEINVVNRMKTKDSIIGGEGSGGVILPEFHYGRDSLAGIALLLSFLVRKNKTLSGLCSEYPKYQILKTKFDFKGDLNEIVDKIIADNPDPKVNTEDGIRIDFERSWVQLRKSNTEPIVRIIAEAQNIDDCKQLTESFKKYL